MPDLNQIKQGEQGARDGTGDSRRAVGQSGWATDRLAQQGDACRRGISGW
jgi:hypothetical protein